MSEKIGELPKEFQDKIKTLQKEFDDKVNNLKKDLTNSILDASIGTVTTKWIKFDTSDNAHLLKNHPTGVFRVDKIEYDTVYILTDFWNVIHGIRICLKKCRDATNEEITKHLEKEARIRGYDKGVRVFEPSNKQENSSKYQTDIGLGDWGGNHVQPYYDEYDSFYMCRTLIYLKGEWAKIVGVEAEKIFISGYEVKFCFTNTIGNVKPSTTIDGYLFTKEFWEAARVISENSKAKIMVGCSRQFDVPLRTIEIIIDRLNQK